MIGEVGRCSEIVLFIVDPRVQGPVPPFVAVPSLSYAGHAAVAARASTGNDARRGGRAPKVKGGELEPASGAGPPERNARRSCRGRACPVSFDEPASRFIALGARFPISRGRRHAPAAAHPGRAQGQPRGERRRAGGLQHAGTRAVAGEWGCRPREGDERGTTNPRLRLFAAQLLRRRGRRFPRAGLVHGTAARAERTATRQ
eukprot:scaffold11676_cov130-Isochrysis_galbana.AAC.4